jgi:hypothetical protein
MNGFDGQRDQYNGQYLPAIDPHEPVVQLRNVPDIGVANCAPINADSAAECSPVASCC